MYTGIKFILSGFVSIIGYFQVAVKLSNAYPKDVEAPASGVDDMTRLAYLHEPGVLQNMRSRFDINEIYVSILLSFTYILKFLLLTEAS